MTNTYMQTYADAINLTHREPFTQGRRLLPTQVQQPSKVEHDFNYLIIHNEEEKKMYICIELSGFKLETFNITCHNDCIEIKAKKHAPLLKGSITNKSKNMNFGDYLSKISFPFNIIYNQNNIQHQKDENGFLILTIVYQNLEKFNFDIKLNNV